DAGTFKFGPKGGLPVVGDFAGPAGPENPLATVELKPLNLDLLGLVVDTSPVHLTITAHSGQGLLLGNVLTTALNTLGATPENLTGLSNNLNELLSRVVGVLNASNLVLPPDVLGSLPSVLQTLATPALIAPSPGATASILNLIIASSTASGPPV